MAMNFVFMRSLKWRYGYVAALPVHVAVGLGDPIPLSKNQWLVRQTEQQDRSDSLVSSRAVQRQLARARIKEKPAFDDLQGAGRFPQGRVRHRHIGVVVHCRHHLLCSPDAVRAGEVFGVEQQLSSHATVSCVWRLRGIAQSFCLHLHSITFCGMLDFRSNLSENPVVTSPCTYSFPRIEAQRVRAGPLLRMPIVS